LHDALHFAWHEILLHMGHPDMEEGARAFLERRTPRWTS
jgi:enoyl-CoA hydratase/carnithine racemase